MTNKCKRGILISKTPYETRYAIMEDGELAELVVDGASSNPILGNIYKGVVKKVVPAAKLAYVDVGLGTDGVLYQDEVVDRNASFSRASCASRDERLWMPTTMMIRIRKLP